MRFFWLVACGACLFMGCASMMRTAHRGEAAAEASPAFLVAVLDRAPTRAHDVVSVSVWEGRRTRALASGPSDAVVMAMREAAARLGADALWIERVDTPWRRAFYGTGLHYRAAEEGEGAGAVVCRGATSEAVLSRAERTAVRCLKALKRRRPGLAGWVGVIAEVGPFGEVRRAVADPAGSRDGEARACLLEAVALEIYAEPVGFGCRLNTRVSMP